MQTLSERRLTQSAPVRAKVMPCGRAQVTGNGQAAAYRTAAALVRSPRYLLSVLLLAALLAALCAPPTTAKTHHSKRQAPEQVAQPQPHSGRESTNWWNLWWQQYISEAMQPSVRPITAVSFNGRTISLEDSAAEDSQFNRMQQDPELDANLVPAAEAGLSSMELARNEKLRMVASTASRQQSGLPASKQVLMANKSAQQQQVWQSARPVMTQPASAMTQNVKMRQAERQNRQVADFQRPQEELLPQNELGIQMRVSMGRQQRPQQQVALEMEPNGFELQQQNQMVDYTEENDPDMEALNNSGAANNIATDMDDRNRTPAAGDSSSSSMMAGGQEPSAAARPKAPKSEDAPRAQPSGGRATDAARGRPVPESPHPFEQFTTTQSPIESPSSTVGPTAQRMPAQAGAKEGSSEPEEANRQPDANTKSQQPQVPSGGQRSGGQGSPASQTVTTRPSPTQPAISAASSSGTPATSTMGSSTDVDVNETPVSMEGGQGSRSTPPTGRVELENGRPATGARPQGSISSGRPPTVSTPAQTTPAQSASPTTRAMQTTTAASASSSASSTTTPAPETRNDNAPSTTTKTAPTETSTNSSSADVGESTATAAEDEEEEEEGNSEQPNLMNSAGDASDEDSADDSDDSDEQEPTSTPAGPATREQQPAAAASGTTQQPPSTTMDIERLPKGSPTPTGSPARPSAVREKSPADRPAPPNANLVMLTLDPNGRTSSGTLDGETAITMPMDTLRRIMMSQMMGEMEGRMREQTTRAPAPTTTTPTTTTSATSTSSSTTSAPATTTTTQSPTEATRSPVGLTSTPATIGRLQQQQKQATGESPAVTESPRKRLQPPPTTRQPRPTTVRPQSSTTTPTTVTLARQSVNPTTASPASETSQRTTVMLSLDSTGGAAVEEESPGGRSEPKIELINLDLMPIQRLMDSQRTTQVSSGSTPEPASGGSRGKEAPRRQPEQLDMSMAMGMDVEPGMRIKPLGGGATRTGSSTMSNPANTVYKIMMTSSSLAPNAELATTTRSQSRRPSTNLPMASSTRPAAGKSLDRQPSGAQASSTASTTRTSPPALAPSTPAMMHSTATGTTLGTSQQQQSTVPALTFTSTPGTTSQSPGADNAIEMGGQPTQQKPERNKSRQPLTGPADSSSGRFSSSDQFVSTAMPLEMRPSTLSREREQSTGGSTEGTDSPSSTTSLSTPSSVSSSQSSQRLQDQDSGPRRTTMPAQMSSSQQPEKETETVASGRPKQQQQFERVQQPHPSGQRPNGGIKTAPLAANKPGKTANISSASFIPTKLRSDFGKFNRIQSPTSTSSTSLDQQPPAEGEQSRANLVDISSPATTTTPTPNLALSMAQNMAIRQFGGANRMSVLTNQPVPFGRPAARTMQTATSSQSRSGNLQQRFELPTFEYGPAIAVRRPDEPLANGQVPNCTLTGKNFCVLTKDYPMNEVRQAVERSFRSVRIMYEELQTVSDQELHKDDFNATNNQAASGKFACQTQVEMMRPGWAKDEITKEWMLVVNTDVFPQRVRTESCAQPNTPCEFIAPFYDSTCQQRYSLHRMIAIDPHDPSRSPQVAVFKFPAGCVCRVHPIRKTTTTIQTTTSATSPASTTVISTSTSKSIRR